MYGYYLDGPQYRKLVFEFMQVRFTILFQLYHDETKFVEEAVHQLLKACRVVKCSYGHGYYLDGPQYRKLVFEFMQVSLLYCFSYMSIYL